MSDSIAVEKMASCRPLKPATKAEDFEVDKLAVLEALRQAGPRGVSTLEFLRRGIGGMRPPNRVHDLRREGHLGQTVREGRQCRFVLVHENPSPATRPASGAPAQQIPLSPYMEQIHQERLRITPLFGDREK